MTIILIIFSAAVSLVCGYFLYGRWLGTKLFSLNAMFVVPSIEFRDENDFVPTPTPIVFGHHFTSIAGTGPSGAGGNQARRLSGVTGGDKG